MRKKRQNLDSDVILARDLTKLRWLSFRQNVKDDVMMTLYDGFWPQTDEFWYGFWWLFPSERINLEASRTFHARAYKNHMVWFWFVGFDMNVICDLKSTWLIKDNNYDNFDTNHFILWSNQ